MSLPLAYRTYYTHGAQKPAAQKPGAQPGSQASPQSGGVLGRLKYRVGNGYRNRRYGANWRGLEVPRHLPTLPQRLAARLAHHAWPRRREFLTFTAWKP